MKHGQWGPSPGDGSDNAVIPNAPVVLLLSGRSRHCVQPLTP